MSSSPRVQAAVVGAGPVGCLAALSLAARGFSVDIYERRPDPRHNQIGSGSNEAARSINLAISSRGLRALSSVRIDQEQTMADVILGQAVPMKARMIHTKDLGNGVQQMSQAYGLNGECINSVSRGLLNELLLDEATEHPSISLHFNCKLRSVDFDAKDKDPNAQDECLLAFENWEGNGPTSRYAAFIVGCDGLNSIVRNSVARFTPMNFSQQYIDSSYLELRIPPKTPAKGTSEEDFAIDPHHLHIWPRHSFMLIALANLDKTFTATLFAPAKLLSGLTSKESIFDFFREEFPDALDLMGPDEVVSTLLPRQGKGSPLSRIECSPYHYMGRAIVLGDAAHAMLPFYGQGLNCGFEDVAFLMDLLDDASIRGDTSATKAAEDSDSSEKVSHRRIDSGIGSPDPDYPAAFRDASPRREVISSLPSAFAEAAPRAQPSAKLVSKLTAAFDQYTERRHDDLVAINYLATQNYYEMSSRVVSPWYLLRKRLDAFLMKTLPKGWWQSLYTMVTFSPEVGYAEAKRREDWQKRVVERVLAGAAVAGVVGLGLAAKALAGPSKRAVASWL